MTPQEAIKHGKEQLDIFGGEHQEFIEMAIKALEQQPCEDCISREILDKIKAEIDQEQYYFMATEDYDEGIRFGLMLAYQIIDKYIIESEDEK